MLDEIDQELLRQCEMNPGQTVATIISPLLRTRKERTHYDSIIALEAKHLIVIDRNTKEQSFCDPHKRGQGRDNKKGRSSASEGGRYPMNNICAPVKNFSTDGAVSFPSSLPILPNGRSPGGILEQVVPAEVAR